MLQLAAVLVAGTQLPSGITEFDVSSNGSMVAMATADGSVQIVRLEEGQRARTLVVHDDVHCLQFSPDSKRVATACMGGKARVFDVESGKEVVSFDAYAGIDRWACAGWSKDGTRLLTFGRSKDAILWNVPQNSRIRSLCDDTGIVETAGWTEDSSLVLTVSDGRCARLWDGVTGEPRSEPARLPTSELEGFALAPDGWRLAVGCKDARARIVDMRTGRVVLTVSHSDVDILGDLEVEGVSFSHDGLHLLTTTELGHEIRCWDSTNGRREWSWECPGGGGKPGGWFTAGHSLDDREVFVDWPATWIDAKSGKTSRTLQNPGKVRYALSADGRFVSGIENGVVVVRDATSFDERYRISMSTERTATVRSNPDRIESGR